MKSTWTLMASALVFSASFVGCTPEAAKKVENAKKETAEAAKATGEAVKEAAKEAVDATKEATHNAVEAVQEKATEAKDAVVDGIKSATESVEKKAADLSGASIFPEISSTFLKLSESFTGIKDADTAKAAVPGIEEVTTKFGALHEQFSKLPAETKKTVADLFAQSTASLKPTLDNLLNLPGVREVLEPIFKNLIDKLDSFKAS